MKTLENFLEKTHLIKVFLFGWLLCSAIFAGMLYILVITDSIRPDLNFTGITSIQIGLALGLLFGLIVVLMVGQMRKSQEFWDYAKVVEEKIENAETKSALNSIRRYEFESLREMSLGGPHNTELYRLHAIMQTKYKFVN